jgi:hypothetical protein
MKRTTRILTVLALAASSVLFATPSQAASSDRWIANVGPNAFLVADISGLVVGTTVTFKQAGSPAQFISPFPAGLTIATISTTPLIFNSASGTNLCQWFNNCVAGTNFTATDTVYRVTTNVNHATYYSIGLFTFDADASGTSAQTRVRGNIKATVDSVTFADDGTGTGGSLSWKGTNIDSVLYTGPAANYPKAYNYGAYTSSWNGALLNLTPDTTYTFDFYVNSIDDYPAMKSVTFKTGPAPATAVVKDIAYWTKFVDTYVIYAQEASNMKKLMSKFEALTTSPYRSFIRVPNSRVSKWSAESLTPNSCRVENQGVVTALSADTCTISYTVSGRSKAPVTLVKDFKFTKFSA